MNQTTDQMSLLDAIGFSAPETSKNPEKTSSKAGTAAPDSAPRRRPAGKKKPAPLMDDKTTVPATTGTMVDTTTEAVPVPGSPDNMPVPEEPDPLTLDRYLCFALYSANHAMHGVYKDLLKDIGLTYPQFLAMTVLWETNNVPVGTITSKLQLDTNTLTPLLKRLEAMGLLTRTRNSRDERQVLLKLTRKGRTLQKRTAHFGSCVLSSSGIAMEDVMDLQSKIMRLRDNLRTSGQT